MTAIVPECVRLEAASATVESAFNTLKTYCSTMTSAWWTYHEIGADEFILTKKPVADQRIRIVRSSNQVQVTLDPANTSAADAAWAPSSAASPALDGMNTRTAVGTRANLAFYPDAVTWLTKDSGNAFSYTGFHVGQVIVPDNSSDIAAGITGHALLVGSPRFAATSQAGNIWAGSNAQTISAIRTGLTSWSDGFTSVSVQGNNGGTVGTRLRLAPLRLTHSRSSGVVLGSSRWFRQRETATAPFTLKVADTGNQAWLTVAFSSSNEALVMLWDKDVTP